MSEPMIERRGVEPSTGVMRARRLGAVVCSTCVLGAVLAHGTAFAQRTRASPVDNARLDLGLAIGAVGSDVELNLTLRLVEDVAVGKVEAEIRLPKDQISFVAPRPAPKGVEVNVQPQPDEGEQTVLKVVAESSDGPIPAGVLATLVVHVTEKATETTNIKVPLEARLWAYPDTSREITPIDTYDGRVSIQAAETFFACFFYMH